MSNRMALTLNKKGNHNHLNGKGSFHNNRKKRLLDKKNSHATYKIKTIK